MSSPPHLPGRTLSSQKGKEQGLNQPGGVYGNIDVSGTPVGSMTTWIVQESTILPASSISRTHQYKSVVAVSIFTCTNRHPLPRFIYGRGYHSRGAAT